MEIRHSTPEDLPRMEALYVQARQFMKETGNPNQWGPTNWPPTDLLRADIAAGRSYVCVHNGTVVGTFCFLQGEDIEPTYREIRERVEDLEKRIGMLDEIQAADLELTGVRADKLHIETLQKYVDIEGCRAKLASRQEDLERANEAADRAVRRQNGIQGELTALRNRLVDVRAELKKSDYGQKQQELQEMEHTIRLLGDSSADWRRIVGGLKCWETDDTVTDYVSNRALQLIDDLARGDVTEGNCGELRTHLKAAMDNISEELSEKAVSIRELTKELREKEEALEDMNNDRKPYPKELKEARAQLQRALSDRYGRTIHVHIFADLFDSRR